MSASSLTADFTVPLFGALLCVRPAITRPTAHFGVRVPASRAGAMVIRRERRAYYRRTAAFSVFAVLVGQLYATALWTGLMLVIYRSGPTSRRPTPRPRPAATAGSWPPGAGPCRRWSRW
jgi:hypothetical protein